MMDGDILEDKILLPNQSKPTIKEKISDVLFDKNNPEMITFLFDAEIERISAIECLLDEENDLRKDLNTDLGFDLQPNVFKKFITSIKIHRPSRKGWRSEQGVKIIQSNIEDESKSNNPFGNIGGIKK